MARTHKATAAAPDDGVLGRDEILYLDPRTIDPDPEQPRLYPDEELAESIRESGVQEAISVRPHPGAPDRWLIINGERRWRGCMAAERWEIPARIRLDMEDLGDRLVNQVITNYGKPLTPLEEALAYQRIMQAKGWSQAQLAKALGVPRSSVGDRLRLLGLQAPWLALLKAGKLTVSQGVELARYASVPEKFAAQAVRWIEERFSVPDHDFSTLDLATFRNAVAGAHRGFLTPLVPSANSWETRLPAAAIARHDRECDCGRIGLVLFGSKSAVPHCGNPDWWKPMLAEAEQAKSARSEKAQAKKAAKRPTSLTLPENAPVTAWDGWGKAPKGCIVLTRGGRWASALWGRIAFDPDDLELDDTKLGRWASPHGHDEGVVTTDIAAVKRAHEAWAARWDARLAELQHELATRIRAVAAQYPFRAEHAEGCRQLLLVCLDNGQAYTTSDIAEKVCYLAQLEGLEVPADVATALAEGKYGRSKLVAEWLQTVPAAPCAAIAAGVVAMLTDELEPPERALKQEQEGALRAISERPTPWAPAPELVACTRCKKKFELDELEDGRCWECQEVEQENLDDEEAAQEDLDEEGPPDSADEDDDLWDAEEEYDEEAADA